MGSRGPVRGTGGRPLGGRVPSSPVVVLPTLQPSRQAEPPVAPAGLRAAGTALWESLWGQVPWLVEAQHASIVEELCRLTDELATYREALEALGPILSEPIVTPTGAVVGERLTANPAEQMARRAGAAMEKLWAALGLTPAARARLGLDHLAARRTMQTIELRRGKTGT